MDRKSVARDLSVPMMPVNRLLVASGRGPDLCLLLICFEVQSEQLPQVNFLLPRLEPDARANHHVIFLIRSN